MAPSNIAALTKARRIVAAKKKFKREQIKEVVFDDDARRYVPSLLLNGLTEGSRDHRRDFLTGFHKRKLQKKEAAKKKAQERERQERSDARRQVGPANYFRVTRAHTRM